MDEFAIYMINTDLVTEIEAAEWAIEDNFLYFMITKRIPLQCSI